MKQPFNPKVSIVIPVYNGSNYVREAIDSALSQTYKNIEIIVINDGSNDKGKTEKICKLYGHKIRYYAKKNGGVASALNMGIEKMEGEYFSWLSHDDVYYPEKIEKQIKALFVVPQRESTILYSNVEYINEKSKQISITKHENQHEIKNLNNGLYPVLKGLTNGCTLLIPKKCFVETGSFNENLKVANDYDMWFRLFRKYGVIFLPDVLVKYRIHSQQGTKVIPNYLTESDEFWSSSIESLKEKEILEFDNSIFSFYYQMAKQMKNASLEGAYLVASEKAKKYYSKEIPEVSVIMPCYNSQKYIKEAVDSILEQTFPRFELIIVDDFSTDKTYSIMKKYKKKDYRVVITRNLFKKGISGALNTGISLSKASKYITRMDSDDISLPERIQKQVSFLEENKEYVFCSVNLSLFGENNRESLFEKKDVPLESLFLWSNPIASAPTMFRKDLLVKNKIKFRDYIVAEDYDFFSRLLLLGKPAMLYEVLYRYRIYSSSTYQKNLDIAKEKSLQINSQLITSLTGKATPSFHGYLTDFADVDMNVEEISFLKIIKWLELLLKSVENIWGWNDEEYMKAFKDGLNRVLNYYILRDPRFIEAKKESQEKSKEIKYLYGEVAKYRTFEEKCAVLSEELNKMKSSKSWKLTSPLRKFYKLIESIKEKRFFSLNFCIFSKVINNIKKQK